MWQIFLKEEYIKRTLHNLFLKQFHLTYPAPKTLHVMIKRTGLKDMNIDLRLNDWSHSCEVKSDLQYIGPICQSTLAIS